MGDDIRCLNGVSFPDAILCKFNGYVLPPGWKSEKNPESGNTFYKKGEKTQFEFPYAQGNDQLVTVEILDEYVSRPNAGKIASELMNMKSEAGELLKPAIKCMEAICHDKNFMTKSVFVLDGKLTASGIHKLKEST